MNIARINPINFNGNITFKFVEAKRDPNNGHIIGYSPEETATIDANKVEMRSLYGIGGYHDWDEKLHKRVYIPKENFSCRIYNLEENKEYNYIPKDGQKEYPYAYYEKWLQDAKDADGNVECPLGIIFMKTESGHT